MPPTSRSGKSKPPFWRQPAWVVRWDSPFGVCYLGKDPQRVGPGRGFKSALPAFRSKIVHEVEAAFVYPTREAAEDAAFKLASQHPEELMGRLEPRPWDGRKKHP